MRRRWLSQLLLVLYVAAVHGLPALHLGWHKNDHVHDLAGLRWLSSRLPNHGHSHATPHDEPAAVRELPAHAGAAGPRSCLKASAGLQLDGLALHLASGPAHAQQSLLAPSVVMPLAFCGLSGRARPLEQSSHPRDLVADQRARAPPFVI